MIMPELTIIGLLIIAFVGIALSLVQSIRLFKLEKRIQSGDLVLEENNQIVSKTLDQSAKYLNQAQESVGQFENSLKSNLLEFEKALQAELERQTDQQIHQQETKVKEEEAKFKDYLSSLSQTGKQLEEKITQESLTRINQLFGRFEDQLSAFLSNTESKSIEAIQLELQAARQLIETYKANQLKLVDENIISILERTLALVLAKKLTLSDHMDLIYQSLERAKAEKML